MACGARHFNRRGRGGTGDPANCVGKEILLIWWGPAVLTGRRQEKGGRLIWQGPAVLTGGGREKGGRVNLAGPPPF